MGALAFPFTIDSTGAVSFARDRVRQAQDQIVNCLTTGLNERVLRPAFGGDVRSQVFEALDDLAVQDLQQQVRQALSDHVSAANVVDIEVRLTENQLRVGVFFTLSEEIDGQVYVATVTNGITSEETF